MIELFLVSARSKSRTHLEKRMHCRVKPGDDEPVDIRNGKG